MKINGWVLFFLLLFIGGGYFAWKGGLHLSQWNAQLSDGAIIQVYLGGHPIFLKVANSPASITQGLSGLYQMPADGMLFVLPQKQIATFWMKGMNFDLDFVWLADGKIVEFSEKAKHPQPNTPDESLKIYSPHEPVDEVIELVAGQVAQLQLKVGDQLEIK